MSQIIFDQLKSTQKYHHDKENLYTDDAPHFAETHLRYQLIKFVLNFNQAHSCVLK